MTDAVQILQALEHLLAQFTAGTEDAISVEAANRIEGYIAESLPEDDELQEFAESLAQYRPEGGDYLFSYTDIRAEAEIVLEKVRQRMIRA
jgi:hypothetical protein